MLLNILIIPPFSSCRSKEVLGEIFNLDIQMGKTKTLGMPWDIIKDKEDLECWIFWHQIQFTNHFTSMAFSLTTAPSTYNHFIVSFSSHTSKVFSPFSRRGSMMIYTRGFCTSHDLFFIFQDAKDQSILQQCCLTTAMLVPLWNFSKTSSLCNRNTTVFRFILFI